VLASRLCLLVSLLRAVERLPLLPLAVQFYRSPTSPVQRYTESPITLLNSNRSVDPFLSPDFTNIGHVQVRSKNCQMLGSPMASSIVGD
jgi:hypothetical protein